MNKSIVLIFLFFFLTGSILAQNKSVKIIGKIIESTYKLPIEYATIALIDKTSNEAISGTITAADGTFSIKTDNHNIYLEISFMGYTSLTLNNLDFFNLDQRSLQNDVVNNCSCQKI